VTLDLERCGTLKGCGILKGSICRLYGHQAQFSFPRQTTLVGSSLFIFSLHETRLSNLWMAHSAVDSRILSRCNIVLLKELIHLLFMWSSKLEIQMKYITKCPGMSVSECSFICPSLVNDIARLCAKKSF